MTIWERLGIAPTTDKKAIKKAYAARVKDCHQEDEPERWAQLHDAYKSALKYAEAGGGREQKDYAAYRESGKDFLHEEQAKTVCHSLWEQAKFKPSREEQELQDDDPEWKAFAYLTRNARESGRRFMEELQRQLEELSQAAPEEEAEKWKEFLESCMSQELYLSEEDWNAVFALLYKKRLRRDTYSVIYEELKHIYDMFSMQFSAMQKNRIEKCMQICKNHIRKRRQKVVGICLVLGIYALVYFVSMSIGNRHSYCGDSPDITSEQAVRTQLADYLNEKYGTTIYQPEMFGLESLEKTCIEDGKQRKLKVGYRIRIADQPEFTAYVLFKYDDKKEIAQTVCFDNLQRAEIEDAFTAELMERLEFSRAEGYLSAGDARFAAGLLPEEDTVYNALFTGDLLQFVEAEKNIRGQIANRYIFIGDRFISGGELNGSFLLYYEDEKTPDLRARLEAEDGNSQIAAELEAFQGEYHIQMTAVGLARSYYEALFEGGEEKPDNDILREAVMAESGNVPLNPAVVSVWFTAPEEEIVTTYPQELFEGQEDSWIHIPDVTELAEGVYALPCRNTEDAQADVRNVLEVKMEEADGRIQIFVNEECQTQYVIVLDKEKLGIGEQYQIELFDEDGEREVTYANKLYTDLDYIAMSYTALDGEDMLLVSCDGWAGKIIDIRWQP